MKGFNYSCKAFVFEILYVCLVKQCRFEYWRSEPKLLCQYDWFNWQLVHFVESIHQNVISLKKTIHHSGVPFKVSVLRFYFSVSHDLFWFVRTSSRQLCKVVWNLTWKHRRWIHCKCECYDLPAFRPSTGILNNKNAHSCEGLAGGSDMLKIHMDIILVLILLGLMDMIAKVQVGSHWIVQFWFPSHCWNTHCNKIFAKITNKYVPWW